MQIFREALESLPPDDLRDLMRILGRVQKKVRDVVSSGSLSRGEAS
jgi:hypothetical protein